MFLLIKEEPNTGIMNRGNKRILFLLLTLSFLFSQLDTAAQRSANDKLMVKAMLQHAQQGGRDQSTALFFSKNADTALLWKKLSVLHQNWKKYGHEADSVQFNDAAQYKLEGTGLNVMLVLLQFRNTNWDELLLLTDQGDNGLLDIAHPEDAYSFNRAKFRRYYDLKETPARLFSFFSDGYGGADLTILNRENALKAAQRIIRLVENNRKDSLYAFIACNRQDDPKRKYLDEPCSPDEARDRAYLNRIFYELQGLFSSPGTMWISANYTVNLKNKSVGFRAECKGTKNGRYFRFVYRKGNFLLAE